MTTLQINNHQVPVTDEVVETFMSFHAYLSLPDEVKFRIDPKAHTYQELNDDFRFAVIAAYDMYLDEYFEQNEDITADEVELEYDAQEMIDIDDLLFQLETSLLETNK